MGFPGCRSLALLWVVAALLLPLLVTAAGAQGFPPLPDPSLTAAPRPQLSRPSNPLGPPGNACDCPGSDVVPLSSGMLAPWLPRIPNLELGFLYNIGTNVRSGRFYADYLVPFSLGGDSVLFGEAHGEFQDFWKRPQVSTAPAPGFVATTSASTNRTDLSFGGGYRKLLGNTTFVGANAFYDATKLYGRWFSSAGVGLEMVALTPADGAMDVNFNWYGNLINRSELINAFRNRAGSWDIEAGVSQPLFDQALDLRLSATAYDFNIGTAVYGWRAGADLTTRDGFFTLRYQHGHDKVNGSYDTIGGYVNIGFSLDNILRGESPFVAAEPVFASPRNLRRLLSQKVRRNWHQPAAVVLSRTSANSGGGCDRFLASVTMETSGGGSFLTNPFFVPFPAFPYTSLDPTKHIVVEFDYEFVGTPPASVLWVVQVRDSLLAAVNGFVEFIPTSQSDHFSQTLFIGDQSNFTAPPGFDPSLLLIGVSQATGTTSLTITNVCIRFNQP